MRDGTLYLENLISHKSINNVIEYKAIEHIYEGKTSYSDLRNVKFDVLLSGEEIIVKLNKDQYKKLLDIGKEPFADLSLTHTLEDIGNQDIILMMPVIDAKKLDLLMLK